MARRRNQQKKPKQKKRSGRSKLSQLIRPGAIATVIGAVIIAVPAYIRLQNRHDEVDASQLTLDSLQTVPKIWFIYLPQDCDSLLIENHDLRMEKERLLDLIEYLKRTPAELDLDNLTAPPANFRSILDSLEILIDSGAVIEPKTLLQISNACASSEIWDLERAERFIWMVPPDDPLFAIAQHNLGVLNGVVGDVESRKERFEYSEMLDIDGRERTTNNPEILCEAEE